MSPRFDEAFLEEAAELKPPSRIGLAKAKAIDVTCATIKIDRIIHFFLEPSFLLPSG